MRSIILAGIVDERGCAEAVGEFVDGLAGNFSAKGRELCRGGHGAAK